MMSQLESIPSSKDESGIQEMLINNTDGTTLCNGTQDIPFGQFPLHSRENVISLPSHIKFVNAKNVNNQKIP